MKQRTGMIAGVALLSTLLGGCTMFRGNGSQAELRAARAVPELAYDGTFEFEFGRAALLEGRYGAAISALRKSELYPRYRAESENGLAIAYAGMGLNDVALHFFRKAVRNAPDQLKFRANLDAHEVRLARAGKLVKQEQVLGLSQPVATRSAAVRLVTNRDGSSAVVPDDSDTSQLVRLSSREVRIVEHNNVRSAQPGAFAALFPRADPH